MEKESKYEENRALLIGGIVISLTIYCILADKNRLVEFENSHCVVYGKSGSFISKHLYSYKVFSKKRDGRVVQVLVTNRKDDAIKACSDM